MIGAVAGVDTTEVFTQVVEAAAGLGAIAASFKLLSIARDYYKLYKEQRDYYQTTFMLGVETPLVQEVVAIPRYELDYAGRVCTIFDAVTGPFGGESGNALGWWERRAAMYATVKDPTIREYPADMKRVRSDWANYLFRFEEHWFDIRNDERWDRRLKIHNIGIKQGAAANYSLATSLHAYQDQINSAGDQLATYANGAARYAGYRRGLSDVSDAFTDYSTRKYNAETGQPYVAQTFGIGADSARAPTTSLPYEASTYPYRDRSRAPTENIP